MKIDIWHALATIGIPVLCLFKLGYKKFSKEVTYCGRTSQASVRKQSIQALRCSHSLNCYSVNRCVFCKYENVSIILHSPSQDLKLFKHYKNRVEFLIHMNPEIYLSQKKIIIKFPHLFRSWTTSRERHKIINEISS